MASSCSSSMGLLVVAYLLVVLVGSSNAQFSELTPNFYSSSCPNLDSTVKSVVHSAISKEARMGASLLRLFFHDCFVNGCDGSILLDDTPNFTGEKMAKPNNGSARGFEVIDQIKSEVEDVCPEVVSCADILAITARDSVVILGGPSWDVKLGRRDARTASQSDANNDIPQPTFNFNQLVSSFQNQGLSVNDMIALSGAHTIGQARCTSFRDHIYNDTNIDASFAQSRRANCPITSGMGDNNLAPLDLQTPTCFDNNYYKNIINQQGLLHSDQELLSNALVQTYGGNLGRFYSDFATSMIKMGDIKPLTGSNGEIRKNCRMIN